MCISKPEIPEVKTPAPIEKPEVPEPPADANAKDLKLKRKQGTRSLRIDLNVPKGKSKAAGVNVPKG